MAGILDELKRRQYFLNKSEKTQRKKIKEQESEELKK